jgi:mono/diheme cytochrome c family protein
MRPVTRVGIAILGLAVIAGVGLFAWSWLRPAMPRIDPEDTAQVARGQAVYAAQCARCHGATLEGQPNWRERPANSRLPAPPHDASGHTWRHPDAVLFGITKHGLGPYAPAGYESDMPVFADVLSDDEIAAALAYIKSRWPAEIRARQAQANQRGAALSRTVAARNIFRSRPLRAPTIATRSEPLATLRFGSLICHRPDHNSAAFPQR